MPIELKTFDTRLQGTREGAEVRHLDPHRAPYYLPIGDEVEMTFRRLFTADGVHNYFWKARPKR